jgi:hypothetical protein
MARTGQSRWKSIANNGTITFPAGQVFPGTGTIDPGWEYRWCRGFRRLER